MKSIIIIACIVGGLIVLFIVISKLGKRMRRMSSEIGWRRIINDPETDALFRQMIGTENFKHAISNLLRPANVHCIKFMSNLLYLLYEGDKGKIQANPDTKGFVYQTHSIVSYRTRMDRPLGLAIWFIAAFPDIVNWINEDENDNSEILYEGIDENRLDEAFDKQKDSPERIEVYKKMVENYRLKVKPILETQ
jgi:hypothetical protein